MAKPTKVAAKAKAGKTPGFRRAASADKEQGAVNSRMVSALQMNRQRGSADGAKGSKPAGYGAFNESKQTPQRKKEMKAYGSRKDASGSRSPRERNMSARNRRAAVAKSQKR